MFVQRHTEPHPCNVYTVGVSRSRERTARALMRRCAIAQSFSAELDLDVCKTTPLYKFEMKVSKRTADWIISLVSDKLRCCGCDRDPDGGQLKSTD